MILVLILLSNKNRASGGSTGCYIWPADTRVYIVHISANTNHILFPTQQQPLAVSWPPSTHPSVGPVISCVICEFCATVVAQNSQIMLGNSYPTQPPPTLSSLHVASPDEVQGCCTHPLLPSPSRLPSAPPPASHDHLIVLTVVGRLRFVSQY